MSKSVSQFCIIIVSAGHDALTVFKFSALFLIRESSHYQSLLGFSLKAFLDGQNVIGSLIPLCYPKIIQRCCSTPLVKQALALIKGTFGPAQKDSLSFIMFWRCTTNHIVEQKLSTKYWNIIQKELLCLIIRLERLFSEEVGLSKQTWIWICWPPRRI